jgi:hypothetical protein
MSRDVRRISVTCMVEVLPKMVHTLVPASTSFCSWGSSAAATFARRVLPKAVMRALVQVISRARSKNSTSFGLLPGQPPSMNETPNASRRSAILILSSHDRLMPSPCVPSRRVVS